MSKLFYLYIIVAAEVSVRRLREHPAGVVTEMQQWEQICTHRQVQSNQKYFKQRCQ